MDELARVYVKDGTEYRTVYPIDSQGYPLPRLSKEAIREKARIKRARLVARVAGVVDYVEMLCDGDPFKAKAVRKLCRLAKALFEIERVANSYGTVAWLYRRS